MRDLAKDSRWLQRQEPNRDNHISVNFYRAYDWLNQAIRAEAEVERLTDLLDHYNAKCAICDYTTEITKLRKVAEAARGVFLGEGEHLCSEFEDAMDTLRQALTELDKEPFND